jgi:hypothetical protein
MSLKIPKITDYFLIADFRFLLLKKRGKKRNFVSICIHESAETENLVTPLFQNGNAFFTWVTEYFCQPGHL